MIDRYKGGAQRLVGLIPARSMWSATVVSPKLVIKSPVERHMRGISSFQSLTQRYTNSTIRESLVNRTGGYVSVERGLARKSGPRLSIPGEQ